jgi:hypothetical protein
MNREERRIAILRFHPSRFGWILVLTLGLWAVVAQAQEYRYHYVSLDQLPLPSGFDAFFPVAINNSGRVYGVACDATFHLCNNIAVYADGAVTILRPGIVYAVNERDTIGGSVLIDPVNSIEQAALFHGDQVKLIPPQPGEFKSSVTALNDSGTALVTSFDAAEEPIYVLYKNGQATPLDFGLTVTQPFESLHINNQGIISGTANLPGVGDRGFRFDTRTGETTLLDPLPTEPYSKALDINNRGNVLGYSSFGFGGIERIGVWDHDAEFKTYFVEGTPESPTISGDLLFNDNNLIVITNVFSLAFEGTGNSYLNRST